MQTENRPTVRFRPRGGAREAVLSQEPEVIMDGPAGTGKSYAWLMVILRDAIMYPGSRQAIVRATRKSLTDSGLVTWEEKVLQHRREGGGLDRSYLTQPIAGGPTREHRHEYVFNNGSVVSIHGADNERRLFSTEFDRIYGQEATEFTLEFWESMHRALRNNVMPYQQLCGDCNPDAEMHWLNQRCNAGQCRRILSRHSDNPTITPEYLERLSNLTGVRRKRLFEGLWVSSEGQVWDNFDRHLHVVQPDRQPMRQMAPGEDPEPYYPGGTIGGIDWGFRNPGVALVASADMDGRLWVRDEVYRCGLTIAAELDRLEDAATAEKGVFAWWIRTLLDLQERYDVDRWLADPSEPEYIDQCRRAGIHVTEANNEWRPGVDLVRDRLALQSDGQPGLYFLSTMRRQPDAEMLEQKRPTSILEEIPSYVYEKVKDDRQPREQEDPGCDAHGCDALRYLVMHADRYDLRGEPEKKSYPKGSAYYELGHDKWEEEMQLREWGIEP